MELETLKELLGITDTTKDALLKFAMADVREIILAYCNVDEIPEGLIHTAYRMAMDIYRMEQPGSASTGSSSSTSEGSTYVSSVTVGDTTVGYSKGSSSTSSSGSNSSYFYGSILKKYEQTMQHFRKVVFT